MSLRSPQKVVFRPSYFANGSVKNENCGCQKGVKQNYTTGNFGDFLSGNSRNRSGFGESRLHIEHCINLLLRVARYVGIS
jgi:hypothetical protein